MRKCFFHILVIYIISVIAACTDAGERSTDAGKKYKVGVCDWMILKRQKIGAFQLAHELGADGIELDMGSLGKRDTFDNKLRSPYFQKLFKEKAAKYNVGIASIAMSGFYGQSFARHAKYKELVQDCLNTMKAMDVKIAFLPLGDQCDGAANPDLYPEVVRRLKIVGDMAAKEGLVIGIETFLDADGEIKLLRDIDSPGIKIYYKFQNPLDKGRDICSEIEKLGKDRICQIHCTDTDGVTLPQNKRLDMRKIKGLLDKLNWTGWLVIERSRDASDVHNVKMNYGTNVNFMKEVFGK